MHKFSISEKLLVEEVAQASCGVKRAARGLSLGELIRFVRRQLGMSQIALARRAGVPQSTVSRIEQGVTDASISTLQKISKALSCELVIAPMLDKPVETIRRTQARKLAERQMEYLKGTMSLEEQRPDSRLMEELLKQEEEELLRGPDCQLWKE